jgi:hypothetical protein
MPAPEAEQDHRGQDVDDEVAVHRRACEEHEPETREHETRGERRPYPEAHDQLRREGDRERAHHQVAREEGEPHLKRAVVEHELQIVGREEEPRETSPPPRGRPHTVPPLLVQPVAARM